MEQKEQSIGVLGMGRSGCSVAEYLIEKKLASVYCFDKNHIPVIIEVKRSMATISAVHQLRMYVNDIKHDFEGAEVRGVLCAPHVPDMVKHLLADYGLEWREVERRVVLPDDFQTTLKEYVL